MASQWIDCNTVPHIYHIKKVSGICFREDGKILLVKKSNCKGWSLSGGKHEYFKTTLIL